jgi:UDP-N-acetylmuramyl pentapeptide phosphotransferase/UDP-N-acetylglucosamine-1-phosphate transferase
VDNLYGLFGVGALPSWLGIGLSIITVVYLINAVNLIDGVDGLAAGISLLALYLFSALMGGGEHLITFAFIGLGLIVFMGFNYSDKRKIFLGDAGSLSLGFILATFAMEFLHSGNNHIVHLNLNPVIVAVLVLGYPVADTIRVFAIRISLGLSPFNADRRHMHHALLDKGFSHFGTTTFIMTVMAGLVLGNKFLAPRLDSHLMILLNILGILLIHLFVRHRSTQLRIFWRSFSRLFFNPVKKVWNKYMVD